MPQELLSQIIVGDPAKDDIVAHPLIVIVSGSEYGTVEIWLTTLIDASVASDLYIWFFVSPSELVATEAILRRLSAKVKVSAIALATATDFAATLSNVANEFDNADFAFIAAGASIPFAWDARLRKTVYASARNAIATSLCDIHPLFTLVDEQLRETGAAPDLIDRSAYVMGNRSYYDVPRVHSICTYLRRDALNLVLAEFTPGDIQATLDRLTRRLRARGWHTVLCDFLYVGNPHKASTISPLSSALDAVEEHAFLLNHPLAGLRRTVNAALRAGIKSVSTPALDSKPVLLHVMHFWGGGLDKWVRDFGHADDGRTNLVFSSYRIGEQGGQRLVLYSDPADPNPIRVWDIAQPIRSTIPSSLEYTNILQQIIREFGVESIIISSLIGHTLDVLNQQIKTLVVCHDFYPICQAINPQFGSTCVRCTLDDLRLCAKENPLNRIFVDQTSEDWEEMRNLYVERLISKRIDLVVPSPSVAVTLKRLVPPLQDHPMHLIGHGIDFPKQPIPIAPRQPGEKLRIVVMGRLSQHKGTLLLKQAAESLKCYADITLVGGGGNGVKLAAECGWTCIEKYQMDELPTILARISPHAALLASVIPETFSYTLSELNQLGIPSLVTALGSFNDRIVDGKTGFLFEPNATALVSLVKRLVEQPVLLSNVAATLQTSSSERTCRQMVNDYCKLIPVQPRPMARFEVGIGLQTGLTEPYRHLNEAYLQTTAANVQLQDAYTQITEANAHLTQAYAQVREAYEDVSSQLKAATQLIQEEAVRVDGLTP